MYFNSDGFETHQDDLVKVAHLYLDAKAPEEVLHEKMSEEVTSNNAICNVFTELNCKLSNTRVEEFTIYWETFASLNFHEFHICEIKFHESIAMPHLLYCTHGSFAKIFSRENFPVYGIIQKKSQKGQVQHQDKIFVTT